MTDEDAALRRVRFYGAHDLAAGWYVERVAELVAQFDATNVSKQAMDVLELHNVQQYLEHGLLPRDYPEAERAAAMSCISQVQSAVARFFSMVDDSNCVFIVNSVSHVYHADLLDLLGRYKAFERCSAPQMLQALDQAGVHLTQMLSCKKLVMAYDDVIRDRLLASAENAEHLAHKYMQKDAPDVHLPASLTPADARDLFERYLSSAEANPNYVGLIENAPIEASIGVDAKLKLRAKRRNIEMSEKFFEGNSGLRIGIEVGIDETQREPVELAIDESDRHLTRVTYSKRWLEFTLDNASILNNFQHLFEFADGQVILTFPSYPEQLGAVERLATTAGRTHYRIGAAFRAIDTSSLLQTRLYQEYLQTKGINLEEVISWFFQEYLADEFGASNFSFQSSSGQASYLERVRNLFAEMESTITQFSLFVDNGELDRELLAFTSDQVRYKQVPSLLPGKYVYPTKNTEIVGILHTLFSDQSRLAYIHEHLRGENAVQLLLRNEVTYQDFHDYQKPVVDQLISLGIIENSGERVQIAATEQLLILKSLYSSQACSYYHLSERGREEVGVMAEKGWVRRHSSLLTEAEGMYFNYFLNKVDFSNGPELRNKYLHGLQVGAVGEHAHLQTYITALRLMIALVIKMNDDFCLSAAERAKSEG